MSCPCEPLALAILLGQEAGTPLKKTKVVMPCHEFLADVLRTSLVVPLRFDGKLMLTGNVTINLCYSDEVYVSGTYFMQRDRVFGWPFF